MAFICHYKDRNHKKKNPKRVENNNRIVERAQDESEKIRSRSAARGVVMVSEMIMVTFEITGVMYEGLFGPGCLLLHI